jgi:hypothetical protein
MDFKQRLKLGQKYEQKIVDIMNNNDIPAILNNSENVKDIDIYLYEDEIYLDSKLFSSYNSNSFDICGIKPLNCMLINTNHIYTYDKLEKETKKEVWIAFYRDISQFKINEVTFVPNSYLVYLVEQVKKGKINKNLLFSIKNVEKLRVDNSYCRSLNDFIMYINELRKIKQIENSRV